MTIVFLEHVINLSHVLATSDRLLLFRLSLEAAHAHGALRERHILIHLKFDAVDVKLLTVTTLYFGPFVSDRVGSFQLLVLHRA